MPKGRLEAFSDGVFAIIITIMVLELKTPHGQTPADLVPLLPTLLGYALSFLYVGIYWNNHHHLLHAVKTVRGMALWANLHLLFWLSLVPFVTGWLDQSHFATWPAAAYGLVLLLCGAAWEVLRHVLLVGQERGSALAVALRSPLKERVSLAVYLAGIGVAFLQPVVACVMYFAVAVLWFVPDRRIEKAMNSEE